MDVRNYNARRLCLLQAVLAAAAWLALLAGGRVAEAGCGDYLGLGHAASRLVSDAWTPLWASLERDATHPDLPPRCQGASCQPAAPTPAFPARVALPRIVEGTLASELAWEPSERIVWRGEADHVAPCWWATRLFRPPRIV